MNMQPIETLEEIIFHIPTHFLYNKCLINKTWFILVKRELQIRLNSSKNDYYEYGQLLKELDEKIYWANIKEEYEQEAKYYEQLKKYHNKYWEIIAERSEITDKMYKYGMLSREDYYEKYRSDYDESYY